jgi:flavin-dependent dehydrogenase
LFSLCGHREAVGELGAGTAPNGEGAEVTVAEVTVRDEYVAVLEGGDGDIESITNLKDGRSFHFVPGRVVDDEGAEAAVATVTVRHEHAAVLEGGGGDVVGFRTLKDGRGFYFVAGRVVDGEGAEVAVATVTRMQ